MSNPLDENLNQDFIRIIEHSPLLLEAFNGLPPDQREAVMREWNGFQWQIILANAEQADEGNGYPKGIPLQLGMDYSLEAAFGHVMLAKPLENLHEYAIVPVYNSYTGEVVSYALSHRTRVFSQKLLDKVLDQEAKHGPATPEPEATA